MARKAKYDDTLPITQHFCGDRHPGIAIQYGDEVGNTHLDPFVAPEHKKLVLQIYSPALAFILAKAFKIDVTDSKSSFQVAFKVNNLG